MGIDCPETRTRDKEEKKYGLLAEQYLCQMIAEKTVTLQSHGEGKFGRVLGVLSVEGLDLSINSEMIRTHHAVTYHGQSRDDIKKEHLANRQKLETAG